MIVLGIDPGLRHTGFGLVESINNNYKLLDYGTISPNPKDKLSLRLLTLLDDLEIIINKYKPSIMSIEEVFYGKNVKSALLLGHARGVAMVCGAKYSIPVFEYSAKKVKQSLTGNGNAHKSQLQFMVMQDLSLKNFNGPSDASDALAIALCHLNQVKVNEL